MICIEPVILIPSALTHNHQYYSCTVFTDYCMLLKIIFSAFFPCFAVFRGESEVWTDVR